MAAVIYIDVLIFTNTVVNYLILSAAEKILGLRVRSWRIVTASFTGSLFTLFIFSDIRGFLFSLMIKVVSTAGISFIAFYDRAMKEYIYRTAATLLVSYLFSGMMVGVYQLFRPPNMLIVNDIVYFEFDPLVMLGVTALIYGAVYLVQKLLARRLKGDITTLAFTAQGHDYSCMAKLDTGCSLTEPFSGSRVIVVDKSIIDADGCEDKRIIPYTAVGGSSMMFAVKASSVSVNEKTLSSDIYIASGAVADPAYKALINPEILN